MTLLATTALDVTLVLALALAVATVLRSRSATLRHGFLRVPCSAPQQSRCWKWRCPWSTQARRDGKCTRAIKCTIVWAF